MLPSNSLFTTPMQPLISLFKFKDLGCQAIPTNSNTMQCHSCPVNNCSHKVQTRSMAGWSGTTSRQEATNLGTNPLNPLADSRCREVVLYNKSTAHGLPTYVTKLVNSSISVTMETEPQQLCTPSSKNEFEYSLLVVLSLHCGPGLRSLFYLGSCTWLNVLHGCEVKSGYHTGERTRHFLSGVLQVRNLLLLERKL